MLWGDTVMMIFARTMLVRGRPSPVDVTPQVTDEQDAVVHQHHVYTTASALFTKLHIRVFNKSYTRMCTKSKRWKYTLLFHAKWDHKTKFSAWCTGPSAWCMECRASSANGASCTLQSALLPHCVPAPVVHIAIHPLSSPSHTPCFHIKRLALMEYCC